MWVKVAEASELSSGEGCAVIAGDHRLALFNDSGEYYAIDDMCPHEGGSLSEGVLHAGRVICPLHSWVFDLRTGRCPRETHEPVKIYPIRCSAAGVEVQIPADGN